MCPNCRGSGNLIAVWDWISPETAETQTINGQTVPNLLRPSAEHHDISTGPNTPRDHPDVPDHPEPSLLSWRDRVATLATTFNASARPNLGSGNRSHSHSSFLGIEVPNNAAQPAYSFHGETQLRDGRPGLIVDIGSIGNLGSDGWARQVARCAVRNGLKPEANRRAQNLEVSGVGKSSQTCWYDCSVVVN